MMVWGYWGVGPRDGNSGVRLKTPGNGNREVRLKGPGGGGNSGIW